MNSLLHSINTKYETLNSLIFVVVVVVLIFALSIVTTCLGMIYHERPL